jgi:RNA polymerase sigma-70 factor (ECF subfamily)
MMQETFIISFEKLHLFVQSTDETEKQIQLEKWLKRIAINKSINLLRKNNRFIFQDLEKTEISDDNNAIDREEIQKSEVQPILQAIASLKPKYSVAISLHLIEGYDYEEMSEIMQLSYQNVRTIVSRAKSQVVEIVKSNRAIGTLSI